MFKKHHILLLLPLVFLQGCSEPQDSTQTIDAVRPAKLFFVSDQQRSDVSSFPGIIKSKTLKEISFTSSGRIQEFPVQSSKEVKAGELIASLDQRELKNKLSQAKSEFKIAQDEYQRLLKLSKTGAVSKSSLQAKKVSRDVASVKLNSAKEAIEDSILIAPFDGVIAQTFVEEGQVITGGQTVALLIGLGDLEAEIDVSGNFLSTLHFNSLNNVDTTSFVSIGSSSIKLPAQFKEATLVADTATQTYGLTFAFSMPSDLLALPGMNVTVDIHKPSRSDGALFIPVDAIGSDIDGTFVWLVDEASMTVTKKHIELMEGIGEQVLVAKGLNVGDTIVTAGVSQLSEGITIRKWQQN